MAAVGVYLRIFYLLSWPKQFDLFKMRTFPKTTP
jgi:hypothetical protein